MEAGIGRRLQSVHEGLVDVALPEWLEGASCGPAAKHLAHLAIHAADGGGSRADWQSWVHEHVPEVSDATLDEAEECMRHAGLWPWPQ